MIVLLIAAGVVLGMILLIPAAYVVGAVLAGVIFVVAHIVSIPYWVLRGVEWIILKGWSLIRLGFLRLRSYRRPNLFL